LNAIGNRAVSYDQESFVTAYHAVLQGGLTVTKAEETSNHIIIQLTVV